MNADTFAEWMRRQGHQVIRTKSSYWYDAGPRVLQAFPYHWIIQPDERELNELMIRHGIISLRYSTPLESSDGMVSYHTILKLPYSIEMLRSQARNGIKRGLEIACVERVSFERMAEEGWKLQSDTLERQGRTDSMTHDDWRKLCLSTSGLPGFEAWAALVDGEMAASIFTTRIDDNCYVPFACSQTKFLNKHVNNALFYTACRDMLGREGVSQIFFSLHSLDAPSSVDEFKFRMSFVPIPVRQRVVFNPLLKPFANQATHTFLTRVIEKKQINAVSKAEGMLRFHLQGKRSLAEQAWPECLESVRVSMVKDQPAAVPEVAAAQTKAEAEGYDRRVNAKAQGNA